MKQLQFENYKEFARDISDKFDNIDDEYGEVSIIAKYNEAKEIINELLCIGHDIASVELHKEDFEEYWDEYILSLNHDGVWCEKFKRDTGYFNDESNVIYIIDNCSSAVIPYCNGRIVYEVSIGYEKDENEYDCTNCELDERINYDELKSKYYNSENNDKSAYTISIKCNLDADEAKKTIADMEKRMEHINDMFAEMDHFRLLFHW